MITGLHLHHFKAFEELDIELRPITLFLGPNNSGKSSVMSTIRILVQTLESDDPQIPILLNGILGDFGTYKDIVFKNNSRRQIDVSLSIIPPERISRSYKRQEDMGDVFWNDLRKSGKEIKFQLSYKYRAKLREIILSRLSVWVDNQPIIETSYSEETERQLISKIGREVVPSNIKAALSRSLRMQNFLVSRNLPIRFMVDSREGALKEFVSEKIERTLNNLHRTTNGIIDTILQTDYIGPLRHPPSRTYLYTGERRKRIGASGENAMTIMVMDSARGGSRSAGILSSVNEWLKKAEIASDVKIEQISDRHYEIRLQHPGTEEYENFADVGYGNSQILPVLVGGYNLQPGSIYLVEEPEIHLHPKAQAELGEFFLDLYNSGVQSIVETHSEYLVLRTQQYVAEGRIDPKDIIYYYVYAKNGKKIAHQLRLDDLGRFIDDWPQGFFPERLDEAKRLSKIRYQKEQK